MPPVSLSTNSFIAAVAEPCSCFNSPIKQSYILTPTSDNIRRWGKFLKMEESKKELQLWVPSGIGKCHKNINALLFTRCGQLPYPVNSCFQCTSSSSSCHQQMAALCSCVLLTTDNVLYLSQYSTQDTNIK